MASGHSVGLVSGTRFKGAEEEIRRKKAAEAADINPELSGKDAETVYRDKRGRKLDMLNEFMRQQAKREGKEVEEAREQYEWGRGTVQKESEKRFEDELSNIKDQPFARTVDDVHLEDMRRTEIRDGDPMAEFVRKKQQTLSGKPARPTYKGPPPNPNRYGIRPGYRWDGCDRGNGFEDKLNKRKAEGNIRSEQAYRYATSDM